MNIAMVAGEASGDQLGAALMEAIRTGEPGACFSGIGGPLMQAAGMDSWWDIEELSVMGLFEVLSDLPRLVSLRRKLVARLLALQPDVFIGIDAPDFNLAVEKRLKASRIPVIHYVSPTIWAWRSGRVKSISRSTDRVMCLFPFEPACYKDHAVAVDYTGHPLADQIPLQNSSTTARSTLGVETSQVCIALLPGSRRSEVERLSVPMLDAADKLARKYPGSHFLMPAATRQIGEYFESELSRYPDLTCTVFSNRSKDVLTAADVVICASGTATLETMLVNRPMVVCYKLAGLTYLLLKYFRLIKSRYFSLPNLLAAEELVPELIQQQVTGERIAKEVSRWLDQPELRQHLQHRFEQIHIQLKVDAAATAAQTVLRHISNADGPSTENE